MAFVFYGIGLLALLFFGFSLAGRATDPVRSISPGYQFLEKFRKDDPNRRFHQISQGVSNLLAAVFAIAFGGCLEGRLSSSQMARIFWVYLGITIVQMILYSIFIHRRKKQKEKRPK